jgi:hypothetical protein
MVKINAGYRETHAMLKIIPQVGRGVSTTGGWGVEILISSRCLRILRIPGTVVVGGY